MRGYLIILLLFIAQNSYSQYQYEWERKYGVDGRDEARDMVETFDKGVVLAGHTVYKTKKFVWVLKLDKNGYPVWGKTYERSGNDAAEAIIQTSDSCMVIAGSSWGPGSKNLDFWVFKIDSVGNTIWDRSFGGVFDDEALSVIESRDGNIVVAGYTNTMENSDDLAIKKLTQNGELIWEQSVGGKKGDRLYDIIESQDGSILGCGYYGTKATALKSFYVAKFDDLGQLIWGEHFNEPHTEVSIARTLVELDNSDIVATGFDKSRDTVDFNMKIVKCDANGTKLKSSVYNMMLEDKGGSRLMRDSILKRYLTDAAFRDSLKNYVLKDLNWGEATSMVKTFDKNIAICGFTQTPNGDKSNFWIVKIDPELEVMWDMILNRSSIDYANCIIETYDKGLVTGGCTYSKGAISWDFAVLKYSHFDTLFVHIKYPWAQKTLVKTDTLNFDISIGSVLPLEKVSLYRNDSLYIDDLFQQSIVNQNKSNYNVMCKVELKQGRNSFYMTIKNPVNNIISDRYDVYFLPVMKFDW